MPWTNESVGGHECEVFRPKQPGPQNYVVIYLHGVHEGRLSEHSAFTEQFEKHGLSVVGPRTRRSWWLNRICPEFDSQVTAEAYLLKEVLPFVQREFNAEPPKLALLGTSMGGQGALRMAYKYPDRFPVVAALSPAIDFHQRLFHPEDDDPLLEMFDDPESARQETAILYIHPLNWPRHQFFCCDPADAKWYDSADRLQMKLSSLGVPYECDMDTTAGGHGFDYYNHQSEKVIDYLINSLASERLRVV